MDESNEPRTSRSNTSALDLAFAWRRGGGRRSDCQASTISDVSLQKFRQLVFCARVARRADADKSSPKTWEVLSQTFSPRPDTLAAQYHESTRRIGERHHCQVNQNKPKKNGPRPASQLTTERRFLIISSFGSVVQIPSVHMVMSDASCQPVVLYLRMNT